MYQNVEGNKNQVASGNCIRPGKSNKNYLIFLLNNKNVRYVCRLRWNFWSRRWVEIRSWRRGVARPTQLEKKQIQLRPYLPRPHTYSVPRSKNTHTHPLTQTRTEEQQTGTVNKKKKKKATRSTLRMSDAIRC